MTKPDPSDLNRFVTAQEGLYKNVLSELRSGQKISHWMWFIFPQVDGLAFSSTSKFYSIKSIEEAREYLSHPVLGKRILECSEIILDIQGRSAAQIFGHPDDMKLKSSMTLFAYIAGRDSVFTRVLDKYYNGEQDTRTLEILEKLKGRG